MEVFGHEGFREEQQGHNKKIYAWLEKDSSRIMKLETEMSFFKAAVKGAWALILGGGGVAAGWLGLK